MESRNSQECLELFCDASEFPECEEKVISLEVRSEKSPIDPRANERSGTPRMPMILYGLTWGASIRPVRKRSDLKSSPKTTFNARLVESSSSISSRSSSRTVTASDTRADRQSKRNSSSLHESPAKLRCRERRETASLARSASAMMMMMSPRRSSRNACSAPIHERNSLSALRSHNSERTQRKSAEQAERSCGDVSVVSQHDSVRPAVNRGLDDSVESDCSVPTKICRSVEQIGGTGLPHALDLQKRFEDIIGSVRTEKGDIAAAVDAIARALLRRTTLPLTSADFIRNITRLFEVDEKERSSRHPQHQNQHAGDHAAYALKRHIWCLLLGKMSYLPVRDLLYVIPWRSVYGDNALVWLIRTLVLPKIRQLRRCYLSRGPGGSDIATRQAQICIGSLPTALLRHLLPELVELLNS